MGKVLKMLAATRDESQNMMMRFPHGSDMYTRFYLQTWGLERMIGIINRTIRVKNKLAARVKTKGK